MVKLWRCDLAFPPGEGNSGDPMWWWWFRIRKLGVFGRLNLFHVQMCFDTVASVQLKPHDLVVGLSRHQWASLLKQVCCWLCIDDIGYTLSSFRSGGLLII